MVDCAGDGDGGFPWDDTETKFRIPDYAAFGDDGRNSAPAQDDAIFIDDGAVSMAFGLRAAGADEQEADRQDQIDASWLEPTFCPQQFPDDDNVYFEHDVVFDKDSQRIKVNKYFDTMKAFRTALKEHQMEKGFKVHKVRTDTTRYRAECKAEGCPWRIVAHKPQGQTFVVITMIPEEHNCLSDSKLVGSMASQSWVAERVVGWLRKDPTLGAKKLKEKLQEVYSVEVGYATVWAGRQKAMEKIDESWKDSFQALYNFRSKLLSLSPGSVVEISTTTCGNDVHFDKLFMALQACIDGFKNGCRPHIAIDSTALNGMYSGQLACACALDGHNWIYPVAWAVFDSESEDNWTWFMGHLKKAIGDLPGLVISKDECEGYGTNKLPQSFNEWVMNIKGMPVVDLVDSLRSMMMELWYKRRTVGKKLSGNILPAIIQQLNEKTRKLENVRVCRGELQTAQVFGNYQDMAPWRHVVDLNKRTCSCGEWQVTRMPCLHALALISTEINNDIESYVHDYYSVDRFKAAYRDIIPPMTDKSQWPRVDTGFKLLPPLSKGGNRRNMIKASHELGARKQRRCKQCGELGHFEKSCTLDGPKKRKRDQAEEDMNSEDMVSADTVSPRTITEGC